MAVRRRVKAPPRVPCDGGCPAPYRKIEARYGYHSTETLSAGLLTLREVGSQLECETCGALWLVQRHDTNGALSGYTKVWSRVSRRRQARYDRTKHRQAHPQTPFWTRAWRLLNS